MISLIKIFNCNVRDFFVGAIVMSGGSGTFAGDFSLISNVTRLHTQVDLQQLQLLDKVRAVNFKEFQSTAVYTPTQGTIFTKIEVWGGGGAGGGCPTLNFTNPGAIGIGSGGGSGGYSCGIFSPMIHTLSWNVTIPAAASGVLGGTGNNGGTTVVTDNSGRSVTALGGIGGITQSEENTSRTCSRPGGQGALLGSVVGASSSIISAGNAGGVAFAVVGADLSIAIGGVGSAPPQSFGPATQQYIGSVVNGITQFGTLDSRAGESAITYGAGGGGGNGGASESISSGTLAATTGGNGGKGYVLITEYLS